MLDFSASAIHRIAQENLDWANLDAIWISHFHLDQIAADSHHFCLAQNMLRQLTNLVETFENFWCERLEKFDRGF